MYATVDRNLWTRSLALMVMTDGINVLYMTIQIIMMIWLAGYVHLTFRGCTIALGYINLSSASIINRDQSLSLTPQQIELIQIEEVLSKLKLNRKEVKVLHPWCLFCKHLVSSIYWRFLFHTLILGGFILNLTG